MHNCSKTVLLVLVCVYLDSCYAVPTFCNEYVHIKVHVPKEFSHEHIYHDLSHEPDFHPPAHKVIHHYHHRRRRPNKKGQLLQQQQLHNEHDALLGSIVLSEVKKPITGEHLEYLQHADEIANNLLKSTIKEAPKKNTNTYTVIEETKHIAEAHPLDHHSHYHWKKPSVETVKIIDAKPPPKHVDTYRVIESKKPTPYRAHKTYTETIKFIEDAYPPKSHVETVKEIDSYLPSTQIEYKEHTGGYHFAHRPHTKTVKVVETKVPRGHTYGGHDHVTAPQTETIEIIETKVTQPTRLRSYGGSGFGYAAASRPGSSGGYIYEDSHSDRHVESYPPPVDSLLPPKGTYLPSKDSHVSTRDMYLPPSDTYLPQVDSELPTNRPAGFHQIRQNSVYEDDYRPSDVANSVGKKYLPPSLSDDGDAYDYSHRAVDSYTGIDSYAAEHVQGVGSGGYRYS